MNPTEVKSWLERGRAAGCSEALFCLGDAPERTFPEYREVLSNFGYASTVEYLAAASRWALDCGLLPHTNAGLVDVHGMRTLRRVNVSLGLMLESASARLCAPGGPHHRAPDKHPALRLRMIAEAGAERIAFTSGILVGIGETRLERVEALLALREVSRAHGHLQEVIVQNFTPRPGVPMHRSPEASEEDLLRAVALARLIFDAEVSIQSPPNLNSGRIAALVGAGLDDFGGISPVTPDYINPRHAWPHLDELAKECSRIGFELRPRLAIHERFIAAGGFLDASLRPSVDAERIRLSSVRDARQLAMGARSVAVRASA